MSEITLEKVDQVKERTGVSYGEAKKALEACNGEVLDAIIYIENSIIDVNPGVGKCNCECECSENIDELKTWLKDLIKKGNVTRIKIRKDETEICDIPVNVGVSAAIIAIIIPQILAFGIIAAVATKLTIEITKADGSVEVVNKYVTKAAEDVKEKAGEFADIVKNKFNVVKSEIKNKPESKAKAKVYTGEETVYTYKVNFDKEEK